MVKAEIRRWHSADFITEMQIASTCSIDESARVYSESDLDKVRRRQILAQKASVAREIFSSRSLFDPRDLTALMISSSDKNKQPSWGQRFNNMLLFTQHYFVFLQLGIVTALVWANADWDSYSSSCLSQNFHFIVNDVFMALFFGIAVVHVTTALLPGGSLFPINKAITPLLGTLGGVLGPALLFLSLVALEGSFATQSQGWAICIATDISVAWLIATQVFGNGNHPAVQFLLLLAVVDDIIGLIVIAVAFPSGDLNLIWLLLLLASFAVSLLLRFVLNKTSWWLYVLIAGPLAWYSLFRAGVHPSLALCCVVPFIPRDNLEKFDHQCSLFVHIGLFFFALSNAGVAFNGIGLLTLNVALSLVLGKTLGIFSFTFFGIKLSGLKLPTRMSLRDLALLAHVSGVGLTVSLFVAELAFEDRKLQDDAKLGALMSVLVAPSAILIGHLFNASRTSIIDKEPVANHLPYV